MDLMPIERKKDTPLYSIKEEKQVLRPAKSRKRVKCLTFKEKIPK